jgi:ABC-type phosphate transport system substrate-binding protein
MGVLVVAMVFDCASDSAARADEAVDFHVIVHPENPSRSVARRFLADAFLKDISRWDDGAAIHPVDLRADSSTRARFSDRVVRRSVAAVKSYWQQRIFSGRGLPPLELDSDADIVRYVQRDRGAVGYVSSRTDIGKTRILAVSYD